MPFRIWRLRNFSSAFVAILFLQERDGVPLFAVVLFTILGKVLPKYPLKPFILTGFAFRCVAALMFAFVTQSTSYWTLPFLGLLVHVVGLGTSVLPAQITALKDAQNEDQGVVGALYSTGMQLGAPLGLVIVTLISENSVEVTATTPVDEIMKSYRNGLFGVVALGVLGAVITAFMMPNTPAPTPTVLVAPAAPVTSDSSAAASAATASTIAAGAGAAAVAAHATVVNLEIDEALAESAERMEMV
ncbi:hypothetical protein BGX24_002212 [Mortierella sp. AD032]|nr:hypothetical protein BGX24_002212 [Mortierella sp. AD032]